MKKRDGIQFYKGVPNSSQLPKWFPKGGVLVLDDLMEEGGQDKRVLHLFTKDSHHRNITVLYLTQDLFPPGKYAKTINKNAHYITAFKNPQDKMSISNILMQMYPDRWKASCSYIMTSPLDPMAICSWTYTLLPTTVFVCGVI